MKKLIPILLLAFCAATNSSRAQLFDILSVDTDSTYISDHSDQLLLRVIGMQKFNKYTLGQQTFSSNVAYRANNNYHLGLGFHYKWIGTNITFKLPYFTNKDLGTTKYFDWQSYIYLPKFAIDLYWLSYRGYYLGNNNVLKSPFNNRKLIREDVRTGNYGVNFNYIFNYKRFSYRAAFIQSQCQIRNAGSFILGGGIHYTHAKADSAFIPQNFKYGDFFSGSAFNKSNTIAIAINGGYAYTYLISKHFFITASAMLGMGLNYSKLSIEQTDANSFGVKAQVHGIIKASAGYNTDKYFIGVQYNNYVSRNNLPILDAWQQLQTGNTRVTIAKRFVLPKRTVKKLDEIEQAILEELE